MKLACTRLTAVLLTLSMLFAFSGCKLFDKMDEAVYGTLDKVDQKTKSEYGSAQQIVDDYAAKMKKEAKTLGKELKAEAPARYKQDGTLAKLLKDKTGVLADLYGEGCGKVSTHVLYDKNGDGNATPYIDALYAAYTEATDLLMDDYEDALAAVQ